MLQLLTQRWANLSMRGDHSGLCPPEFWKPPRTKNPQPFWGISSNEVWDFFPITQSDFSLMQLFSQPMKFLTSFVVK